MSTTHLVEVDGRLEGVVGQNVVVPHTDLTEVTRVVLWGEITIMSSYPTAPPRIKD